MPSSNTRFNLRYVILYLDYQVYASLGIEIIELGWDVHVFFSKIIVFLVLINSAITGSTDC